MARFRKPFFRPARGLWYVWHGGKQINLGSEKDAAFAAFHELKSKPEPKPVTAAEAAKLVVVIVDQFLDWCEKNRAPDTYRWYKDRINSFCKTIDANMLTEDLLKQSQSLAKELQSQQQELQQTNIELGEKAQLLAKQNTEVESKNA